MFKSLVSMATVAVVLCAGAATASTVNFSDGTVDAGNKEYREDGFLFTGIRVVGGNCFPDPNTTPDDCGAENTNESIVMTREGGGAFDLSSIWFQILGNAGSSNQLTIFETSNTSNSVTFSQPTYDPNTGYTETLTFANVLSLTFQSLPDGGNIRIDNLHATPVPLPAAGFLLLAGVGGLAALKRRKKS